MRTWIQAVKGNGGFGKWGFDVVFSPAEIRDAIMI
jgi:hypothetical protein